ncbi:MAG: hypothetical protein LC800_06100 [Acidobacteria bacterium]|nr:hypothetical protein [Acidobacteriota bacterium]
MPVRLSRSSLVRVSLAIFVSACALAAPARAQRKKQGAPAGGARYAVVADERLSALRDAPGFSAALLQRLGRGRSITLTGARKSADGAAFVQVVVTRRTRGWVQAEGVFAAARAGDDERLLRLVRGSLEFDRVERARIFLDTFPRSPLRPAVLLLLGEAAEAAAARLSRDALRRLDAREMEAGGAPAHTYFLNFNGLDRFNRVGVRFTLDRGAKTFHYDGESWREILRRHAGSPEAAEARRRLEALPAAVVR